MKQYIAEGVGTFVLTLVVGLSLSGTFPVSTPVLAGLTLGLFVYTIGSLSGCHINPGVTIGAWSIGKIQPREAGSYIVSQLIGGLLAWWVIQAQGGPGPQLTVLATGYVWLAEIVGMMLFTFGIASVLYEKTPGPLNGVVIGGSLLLGIAVAVLLGSNGVLNPAVAVGIGSANVAYLLAPLVGAILGMRLYSYLTS